MAGATLSYTDGTAKTATSAADGSYSFTVSYNWSGSVTPSLAGYTFSPADLTYTNVQADQTGQDYTATAIANTYTLSGNAGEAGVTLSYTDGTAKTATSAADGSYSFTVSSNWSGSVTPTLSGYTFSPAYRTYSNVQADQTGQDYTATAITYTISGDAGVAGATLSYTDGTPKTATADSSGNYSFAVSYGWSGTVTPSKTGYTFSPVNRSYTNVLADQTGQDYTATAITYTISGNAGVAGVNLSYTDGFAKTAMSDSSGNYSFTVSYNWSGMVTPSKLGYVFSPSNHTYSNVMADQTTQNYNATLVGIITAGGEHTCWLKSDGTLACWGDNSYGQATPPGGTFTQVSAGDLHTCGIKSDGTLACWGDNSDGQSTPPGGTFLQVSAGIDHTCGLKSDGTLACWGDNSDGQSTPPGGTFTQVSAGDLHTCGIKSDGTLACWGDNGQGQSTPPSGTFTQISAGYEHTCGVKSDGTLACWGDNSHGQSTPLGGTFTQVSSGNLHTCGLKSDGTLACWGSNSNGQSTPPPGIFTQVSAGGYHTCGLRNDGTLTCWGDNSHGQSSPFSITGNAGVAGATLSYTDGTAKTATSAADGSYSFTVSYNWSGTVT
ncbi:MAG: hypothetical protein ABSB41_16555, partial [Anaerolineales bacterium]